MNDDIVAQDADLGVPCDLAVLDVAAGNGAHGGNLVGFADLGVADDGFPELGVQHTLHGGFNLVDGVIDDAVHAHIHLGALGRSGGSGIGADVEADNDGVGRGSQQHVGFVDGADAGVDNLHADLVVGDFQEAGLDGLGGALHIGLDDDVQLLHVALLNLGKQIVQGDLGHGLGGTGLLLGLALLHQLAGHALILNSVEDIAGTGNLAQTRDLHGDGGTGFLDGLALVVGHDADTAHGGTGNDDIALMQGAVLDQQGGNGAAGLVQTGLDDGALGAAVGIGFQLLHFGGQQDHLQQVVDALALLGGDGHHDGVAAPLLGHQIVFGDLLLDAVGVGLGLIHLVDGHDDGNFRGFGVVDGLDGLGHDAVVGGHHQNGNIGTHGAAGTHGRKGGVAGGIQERNGLVVDLHLIGADVLGNAAGLAGNHVGLPNGVQQGRLAVVDVAHNHDDGAAGLQLVGGILVVVDQSFLDGDNNLFFHLAAQLHGYQGGGVIVDDLIDGGHNAQLDQLLNDLSSRLLHAAGQLAHGDLVGDFDGKRRFLGNFQLEPAHFLLLLVAALVAEIALLLVVAALLAADALLAALGVLHALGHQGVHPVVEPLGVDRNGGGVNHTALAAAFVLLGLLFLLLTLGSGGLVLLFGSGGLGGLGRLVLLLLRGFLCGLGRSLGLAGGLQGLFQRRHLMALGKYVEQQIQLVFLQDLHMVLGLAEVLLVQLHDDLGGYPEVLGDLVDAIFH